jgi:hypothetical protein
MIVGNPSDTQKRACLSRSPCRRRSLDKLSNQLGDAHTLATRPINKEIDLRFRQRYLQPMHGRRHGDVRIMVAPRQHTTRKRGRRGQATENAAAALRFPILALALPLGAPALADCARTSASIVRIGLRSHLQLVQSA